MSKKSVILHAIKTNRFPEATDILKQIWKRLCHGLPGIHFNGDTYPAPATRSEICMMRGWSINHPESFSFTTTHDLCDASFTRAGIEKMVRAWYARLLEERIEAKKEFERKHPEMASVPHAGRRVEDLTLDEFIFDFRK